MDTPTIYPVLSQMFGAFFHQDWPEEGKEWPDLVENFSRVSERMTLVKAADEITKLLAESTTDAELEDLVFQKLGCDYTPRPDLGGPSVRDWLKSVAALLREKAKGK